MPVTDPLQGATFLPAWADAYQLPQTAADMYQFLLDRSIPRFATTAERDGAYPAPTAGKAAWADGTLWIYDDGDWQALWALPVTAAITAGSGYTSTATSELSSDGWVSLSGVLTKSAAPLVRAVVIGVIDPAHWPASNRRCTAALGNSSPAGAGASGITIDSAGQILLLANSTELTGLVTVWLDGVRYKKA